MGLQTEAFTEALFNQVANVSGLFTGLAFFYPEQSQGASPQGPQPAAEITIQVFLARRRVGRREHGRTRSRRADITARGATGGRACARRRIRADLLDRADHWSEAVWRDRAWWNSALFGRASHRGSLVRRVQLRRLINPRDAAFVRDRPCVSGPTTSRPVRIRGFSHPV